MQTAISILIFVSLLGSASHGNYRLFILDIRTQLQDQLRVLDGRVETQVAIVGELADYFKKRAEVEQEYSKALDKLARTLTTKHKENKNK